MMRHPPDHTCNMSTCIRGCIPLIWGLHPDMIAHIISHLLLFGLIWRESIDTFQLDAVAMNQVGRSSQRQHFILRGDIVLKDCFHYGALFPCCDPFHALMTSFHNAIPEWTGTQCKCNQTPHSLKFSVTHTSLTLAGLSGIHAGWGTEINGRFEAKRSPALAGLPSAGWAATLTPLSPLYSTGPCCPF